MFNARRSCATSEDWFDSNGLRDDYVPTGSKGYEIENQAVPRYEFGPNRSSEDKSALVASMNGSFPGSHALLPQGRAKRKFGALEQRRGKNLWRLAAEPSVWSLQMRSPKPFKMRAGYRHR